MLAPLRIAVIGTGHLGRIHAKLLSQVDGAELTHVVDPNVETADAIAQTHGVRHAATHGEILSDFDAAIVAAPTGLHASIVGDLLRAGKHVLCEKPLTVRSDDAAELATLARRNRLTLQVGHVERFNPAFTALGEFACDVKYVECVRASSFPGRCLDVGVVMDLMIHDLDLILSLTDAPIIDVRGSGVAVVSDHEDIAEARVEFGCGLVANVKANRVAVTPTRSMQLYGPAGFADIDFGTPSLTTVAASKSLADRTFDLNTATDDPLTYRDDLFADHLRVEQQTLSARNAILDEQNDFVLSIRSGTPSVVDGDAGARAVDLAERITRALAKRSWYDGLSTTTRGIHVTPRRDSVTTVPARRAA